MTGLPHTGTPCLPGILVPGKVRKHTNKGCPHNECDVLLTQVISASQVFITAMLHGRKRRERPCFGCVAELFFFPPNGKYSKNLAHMKKKERNGRALSLGGNDKTTMNLSYYCLLFISNANTGFSIENRGFAARFSVYTLPRPQAEDLGTVVTTGAILLLSWFISRYNVVSPHAGVSWDMKSYSVPFSFQ